MSVYGKVPNSKFVHTWSLYIYDKHVLQDDGTVYTFTSWDNLMIFWVEEKLSRKLNKDQIEVEFRW